MTIMTIRIPDDVAAAFDKAFEGQDKDAVIADMIRRALENRDSERTTGSVLDADDNAAPRLTLVERFRKFRESAPSISQDEIRRIREEGRP